MTIIKQDLRLLKQVSNSSCMSPKQGLVWEQQLPGSYSWINIGRLLSTNQINSSCSKLNIDFSETESDKFKNKYKA